MACGWRVADENARYEYSTFRAGELRSTLREDLRVRAIPADSAADRKHMVPIAQENPQPHRPEDPCRCDLSLCSACPARRAPQIRRDRSGQQESYVQCQLAEIDEREPTLGLGRDSVGF
jgi:hypothetical protein